MKESQEFKIIDSNHKLMWLPFIIRNFFVKKYYNQGIYYIDNFTVLWLDKLEIETISQKRADELSWEYLYDKYPQYDNIQLF